MRRKEEEEWPNLPILQTQPPQRMQKTTLLPLIIIIIIIIIVINDIIIILTILPTDTPLADAEDLIAAAQNSR